MLAMADTSKTILRKLTAGDAYCYLLRQAADIGAASQGESSDRRARRGLASPEQSVKPHLKHMP